MRLLSSAHPMALEGHARPAGKQAMATMTADGATKPCGPAGLHQRRLTLCFGAIEFDKFRH